LITVGKIKIKKHLNKNYMKVNIFIAILLLMSSYAATAQINSLEGLENLQAIQGDLIISKTNLTNLDALASLEEVKGNVIIKNNLELRDFCGLQQLFERGSIGGTIQIEGNLINPNPNNICEKITSSQEALEKVSSNIKLYPNPATTKISILMTRPMEVIQQIAIFDLVGKPVLSVVPTNNSISIETLPNGVYTIQVQSNLGIQKSQFIKQ